MLSANDLQMLADVAAGENALDACSRNPHHGRHPASRRAADEDAVIIFTSPQEEAASDRRDVSLFVRGALLSSAGSQRPPRPARERSLEPRETNSTHVERLHLSLRRPHQHER